MICRFKRDLPPNLSGYAIWLQVHHDHYWYSVCTLRATDARQLLRWNDIQTLPTKVRVAIEPLAIR